MKLVRDRVNKDKTNLAKLVSAGDDEQIVRQVDHSFTSVEEHRLAVLADIIESMDFGDIQLSQSESGDAFLLECTSIDCTEFHNIVKTSVLMEMLAQQHGVKYDGWGSAVVSEAQR